MHSFYLYVAKVSTDAPLLAVKQSKINYLEHINNIPMHLYQASAKLIVCHCGVFFLLFFMANVRPSFLSKFPPSWLCKHNLMNISQTHSGRLTCMSGSSSVREYVKSCGTNSISRECWKNSVVMFTCFPLLHWPLLHLAILLRWPKSFGYDDRNIQKCGPKYSFIFKFTNKVSSSWNVKTSCIISFCLTIFF